MTAVHFSGVCGCQIGGCQIGRGMQAVRCNARKTCCPMCQFRDGKVTPPVKLYRTAGSSACLLLAHSTI